MIKSLLKMFGIAAPLPPSVTPIVPEPVIPRPPDMPKAINLKENDNGSTFTLNKGDRVIVSLAWKPSSGYFWQENETTGGVLEEVKHEGDDTKPGGIVYVHFKFRVSNTGVIRLSYARPWAETDKPTRWFEVNVILGTI
jgi:predicted secreted protein